MGYGAETQSDFDKAIRQTTFRHPFIKEYTFVEAADEKTGTYRATFKLAKQFTDELLRNFGEELYLGLRERGYLVNISLYNHSDNSISFTLEYTGMKSK